MSEGIDNQAHRITTLKHIITHLHEGHAPGQVTRDILKQRQNRPELPPGHPAETFQRENEALRGVIKELRTTIADLRPLTADDDAGPILLRLRQSFSSLMDIDKHYKRKEQVLFPC